MLHTFTLDSAHANVMQCAAREFQASINGPNIRHRPRAQGRCLRGEVSRRVALAVVGDIRNLYVVVVSGC